MEKNIEYSKSVLKKISVLLELIDSLNKNQVPVSNLEVFIGALIIKLTFHATSMIKMFDGIEWPISTKGKVSKIYDEPSIIILLRVIVENYLTFFYLFVDDVDKSEKEFRFNVWQYAGMKQRIEFIVYSLEDKIKQEEETVLLEIVRNKIITSQYFNQYNGRDKKQILEGKKPRLLNSWLKLLEKSKLQLSLFKDLYGYKSSYSHSEFNSIVQVMSKENHIQDNNVHYTLELLHFLVCKTIIDFKQIFPTVEGLFKSMGDEVVTEIINFSDLVTCDFNT